MKLGEIASMKLGETSWIKFGETARMKFAWIDFNLDDPAWVFIPKLYITLSE